jgi:hypothetical protein
VFLFAAAVYGNGDVGRLIQRLHVKLQDENERNHRITRLSPRKSVFQPRFTAPFTAFLLITVLLARYTTVERPRYTATTIIDVQNFETTLFSDAIFR